MDIVSVAMTALYVALIVALIILRRLRFIGTLKIDKSDPEKDRYRFEIDNLENLEKRKYVVLKVDKEADLSRK